MISAVEKHASDSYIIDRKKLNEIIVDPDYNSKIRANTTIGEKVFLGIPLVDFSNTEGSAIPNSQEEFSDTPVDSTDESNTSDSKKSFIRKHKSEPLPRRRNKPVITRRNTR